MRIRRHTDPSNAASRPTHCGAYVRGLCVAALTLGALGCLGLPEGDVSLSERAQDAAPPGDGPPHIGPSADIPRFLRCVGDTAPLPDSAASPWGPAARVVRMDVPMDAEDGRAKGCEVHGANLGSGVQGLITLIGDDLTTQFHPDDQGEIEIILLTHLEGWRAGRTAGGEGQLNVIIYDGDPDPDHPGRFLIDRSSFFDPDALDFPRASLAANLDGCNLLTVPGDFSVSVPRLYLPDGVRLSRARMRGHVTVDPKGFRIQPGMITGYLTRNTLEGILDVLYVLCNDDKPPEVCEILGGFLSADAAEVVTTLLFPILGGADVMVLGDTVRGDCGDACNAVSVCLLLEAEPAYINGIGED